MLTVALVGAVVVAVDQVAKSLALRHLVPGTPIPIIEGVFALRLGFNPGLAFGLLAGLDEGWRWLVWALSMGALVVLARVAYRILPSASWAARVGLGLVFGGAVGNLVDRARLGAVVDFLDVYWRAYHWPAFNTADAAISVGVVLLALALMKEHPSGASP